MNLTDKQRKALIARLNEDMAQTVLQYAVGNLPELRAYVAEREGYAKLADSDLVDEYRGRFDELPRGISEDAGADAGDGSGGPDLAEHTPGPWVAIEGDTFHDDRPWGVSKYLSLEACQEIDGDEATWPSRTETIAEVCGGASPAQVEADARLMASAPDLLAACEHLLWQITAGREGRRHPAVGSSDLRSPVHHACEAARAAIAKARAKPQ